VIESGDGQAEGRLLRAQCAGEKQKCGDDANHPRMVSKSSRFCTDYFTAA
jgi:hypothetical protein